MAEAKQESKKTIWIIIVTICVVGTYLFGLWLFNKKGGLKENEYGDYVGGVLNPIFTLLSTVAIIYLTYIISKSESRKADEAIQIQKRLALNQMRHEALNALCDKLNLFIYENNKYKVINERQGKFFKTLYANELEENGKLKNDPNLWLIILFEVETFSNKRYLFEKLFDKQEYQERYEEINKSINALFDEHNNDRLISINTLTNYLRAQESLVEIIGNFILVEY